MHWLSAVAAPNLLFFHNPSRFSVYSLLTRAFAPTPPRDASIISRWLTSTALHTYSRGSKSETSVCTSTTRRGIPTCQRQRTPSLTVCGADRQVIMNPLANFFLTDTTYVVDWAGCLLVRGCRSEEMFPFILKSRNIPVMRCHLHWQTSSSPLRLRHVERGA